MKRHATPRRTRKADKPGMNGSMTFIGPDGTSTNVPVVNGLSAIIKPADVGLEKFRAGDEIRMKWEEA